MTDPITVGKQLREFERFANDRFHDHGKHISRIEGIFEERTRALAQADHDQREQIAAMGQRMDKVEERLSAKIENVGSKVDALGNDVVRQGVRLAIYVTLAGAAAVVGLNTFVRHWYG